MIVIKPFRSVATPPYLALSPPLCCVFLRRVCGFPAHSTFYVFVCLPLYQGEDWAVHPVFPALRTAPGTPGCSVDIRCVTQTCPPSTGSLGEQRVCFLSYPTPFPTPPSRATPPGPADKWLGSHGGKDEPDLLSQPLWGFEAQRTGVFGGQAEGWLGSLILPPTSSFSPFLLAFFLSFFPFFFSNYIVLICVSFFNGGVIHMP